MRIISLFSGAGGLDLGFIRAGHTIVWANDIDPDAVETYRKNIGKHVVLGDLAEIPAEEIPDADIIMGGFPCQGFSQANVNKVHGDERNLLYIQFCRVLNKKKPYYFLAENVRGILSLDKGMAIKRILSDFSNLGYRVQYRVLNAADYGVPQNRIRVIIVGTRKDLPPASDYEYPSPTHSKKPIAGLSPWVSIGEALSEMPEPEDTTSIANHCYSKYKITNRNFTGHRKTAPDKPSPTILARGNGKGGVCAIQHPNNHRRMSIRESAVAQSFPMDFEFTGKLGSCYRQVGNAVAVLLAEKLAEKFLLFEKRKTCCA